MRSALGLVVITDVEPHVELGGPLPAKAAVGQPITFGATIFRDGHDQLDAEVVLHPPGGASTRSDRLTPLPPGNSPVPAGLGGATDRWAVTSELAEPGGWQFCIRAWRDPLATWRHDAEIKVAAGVDVELMLEQGARLFERLLDARTGTDPGDIFRSVVAALRDVSKPAERRLGAALAEAVWTEVRSHPLRESVTSTEQFDIWVDRERALFGSWYEFFPRSEGAHRDPDGRWRSGTFADAAKRLPAIAAMGFDVVYLPPVHPIGEMNRKGANNTLDPAPDDPGSPWAIGSRHGGHDSIHPDLGTIEDFTAFVAHARASNLEVAMDLALQVAPDHPWVTQHPSWFTILADGSIAYAENPPKKYQDIYPLNFDHDFDGILAEVLRIVRGWMGLGVRAFRVDNPHTKPVIFWHRLLGEIRRTDPDVIFLAEAFTRPPMLHALAKVGFHQSYTYFTWRNTKRELQEYAEELTGPAAAYLRPNFFVNTQDILHEFLQSGAPGAFRIRAVLAATLSPTWGMYSGFELYEDVPLRPGSEEYLDSEKYQYRPRDWTAAEATGRSLAPLVTELNRLRRAHRSLQLLQNLTFHPTDTEHVLAYSKLARVGDDIDRILCVVNLDPHQARQDVVHVDLQSLALEGQAQQFEVRDELSGRTNAGEMSGFGSRPAPRASVTLCDVRRGVLGGG